MGNFRIEIEAVGGHGDSRDIKDGEELDLAGLPSTSVDRVAHEAVESLKGRGASIVSARIVHWPGQSSEVVDDVLAKTRHGSF
jgi:hypothetical protein